MKLNKIMNEDEMRDAAFTFLKERKAPDAVGWTVGGGREMRYGRLSNLQLFFLNGAGSREVSSTTQREEGRQEHQESSF